MKNPGLRAGALLLIFACRDQPAGNRTTPSADTALLRADSDTAAAPAPARDSEVVARRGPAAPLLPNTAAWTTDPTAVELPAGRPVTLRAVRQSGHAGFDRIVFDFGADSMPGYLVGYVPSPQHRCGSGEEVRPRGAAWLVVKFQPVQAHDDAGNATVTDRAREPGLDNLLELQLTCDFEGHVEWLAGVARRRGYRVSVLRNPTRLAVDVRH